MNKVTFPHLALVVSSISILWLGYSSPAKADFWDQTLPQIIDIINDSQNNQNSPEGNPAPADTIPNGQLDIEPESAGSPSIPQSGDIPVENIPSGQILLPDTTTNTNTGGQVCGGFAGISCPSNQTCVLPEGTIEFDAMGVCQ